MKLKTYDGYSSFLLTSNKEQGIKPLVYLNVPRIIISNSFWSYGDLHENVNFTGILPDRNYEREADILAFDCLDGKPIFFYFTIPADVQMTTLSVPLRGANHELVLNPLLADFVDAVELSYFNETQDALYLCYEPIEKMLTSQVVQIAQDFFLLHENNNIVGWSLKNCTHYLCDSEGNRDGKNNRGKALLARYFQTHTADNFVKINSADLEMRKQLEQLKYDSQEHGIRSISETMDIWIEDNY